MLLIAARILSRREAQLHGNVLFVFQPNEENAGALPMIQAGLLDDYPVQACAGLHLWPALPTGMIGLSAGPVMAGLFQFKIVIQGQGGHTGYPHLAVDPVLCAAEAIQALQMIQTRQVNALEPTILMIGKLNGGTASNIIPDQVTMEGTVRYLHEDRANAEKTLQGLMERIIAGVCQMHRTGYEFSVFASSPVLVNDPGMVEVVRAAALEMLGDEGKITRLITPVGEDFAEFSSRVASAYYFLGCGNPQKGACYPHHHPRFDIDEAALKIGVEMHVRTALRYLAGDCLRAESTQRKYHSNDT